MENHNLEKYLANLNWFNQFFNDLETLFELIAGELTSEFPLPQKNFYYFKSNFKPSIPPYYLMGLGGELYSIQAFWILDPSIIGSQPSFLAEPSLIIVKHSRGDRSLWINDLALKIFKNDSIKLVPSIDNVISGTIIGNEETNFHAFQILLDPFSGSENIKITIRNKIVDVLKQLPEWETQN
jgi:hypothetical protein